MKKLVVFDLDNTLTDSKTPLDSSSAELVNKLLTQTNVAVISGASFEQINRQFIEPLNAIKASLPHLFILPTSGGELCVYENEWKKLYSEKISSSDKRRVRDVLMEVLGVTKTELAKRLEDRQTGMTYSALGINAPLDEKRVWDPNQKKRIDIRNKLLIPLTGLSVTIGGTTSIDISKEGIDKAFGVRSLMNYLKLSTADVVFVGDALFPGGNDSAVTRLGIDTIVTTGPENTKNIISKLIE